MTKLRNKFIISLVFILIFSTCSFALTVSINKPFKNFTKNTDFDWISIAAPQILIDAFYPLREIALISGNGDISISGQLYQAQGGVRIDYHILKRYEKREDVVQIISNPHDALSMRNAIVNFIFRKLNLAQPVLTNYPKDALYAYYQGVFNKYIGEEIYKDSSFPTQVPWSYAINYLKEATKLAPNFKEAYRELAYSYKKTRWYSEEIKAWTFYLNLANDIEKEKVSPDISQAYFYLAYSFYRKGRIDIASEYFKESIKYNFSNMKSHYWMGRIYYNMDKLNEAKKEWEIVLSLDPSNKDAKYFKYKTEKAMIYGKKAWDKFEKGYMAYKNKRYNEAIDYLNEAMELNYNLMDTYYILGRLEIEIGNIDQALFYLKQGLSVNPNDKKIIYLIKLAKQKK